MSYRAWAWTATVVAIVVAAATGLSWVWILAACLFMTVAWDILGD
jgi:hypothetical protein